ncbi:MAG: hypothetical protein IJZ96_03780 [Lachnospiraceae bacterium]|nr:hypothetical protein [Lachnospiraceae bacterium]
MDKMIVDGYEFSSGRDAKLAIKEKSIIEKIKSGIDINDTKNVYDTYNKLVSKNYFVTPVGLTFLTEMRDYLTQFYSVDELKNINVPSRTVQNEDEKLVLHSNNQIHKLELENTRLSKLVKVLTVAVIAMVILIIGMFFIVITNENLGYFNAEEKILNKYSAWQERLEGWEQELIEREEQLNR